MRTINVALTTLALLLACTAMASAMSGADAIYKANEAENIIDGVSNEVAALSDAPSTESTETVDGITYTFITHADPETGKTLRQKYDQNGNLVTVEYYNPETGLLVTTEYDETGNVVSDEVATVGEDGTVLESTTIYYNEDESKTYVSIDYTETSDNKVTTTIKPGGDVTNPDHITEQISQTQPGVPREVPVEITCPNTGQSEIDVV